MQALPAKSPTLLSWTHYVILQQVNNSDAREWYEQESTREMWSTRTLQRNVSSQYYFRLLRSQHAENVHDEMQQVNIGRLQMAELVKALRTKHLAEFGSYTSGEPMFTTAKDVLEYRTGF